MGIVLLWIGALKLLNPMGFVGMLGSSPLAFLATPEVAYALGTAEIVVGGLFFVGFRVRYISLITMGLFVGTLVIFILTPKLAYGGAGFPVLSLPGEFLLKDLVLLAASTLLFARTQAPETVRART